MSPSFSPDDLSRRLASWRVQPPRDPRFRSAVLARLASADRTSGWLGYARQHAGGVAAALTVAVAAGALGGWGSARYRAAADREELLRTYVDSLDGRSMRQP